MSFGIEELGVLPLSVLGIGIVVGIVIGVFLLRSTRKEPRRDLELRREDLERERDQLYERLRGAEDLELTDADREELETTAARVLRDLDALEVELGPRVQPAAKTKDSRQGQAPASTTEAGGWASRHPAAAGALLGGGLVALVAVLIFWASSDARPAPPEAGAPMATGQQPGNGIDRGEPPLPPGVSATVDSFRERLNANPDDQATRRQLAELLLAHNQFFDAFQEANALLQADGTDPVGHYVSGIVRYTMGQPNEAIDHFASALESDPGYVPAALVQGIILLQLGDRERAVASWEQGLAAAGGSEPRLEHLLRLTREGKSAEEILSSPPPG